MLIETSECSDETSCHCIYSTRESQQVHGGNVEVQVSEHLELHEASLGIALSSRPWLQETSTKSDGIAGLFEAGEMSARRGDGWGR